MRTLYEKARIHVLSQNDFVMPRRWLIAIGLQLIALAIVLATQKGAVINDSLHILGW